MTRYLGISKEGNGDSTLTLFGEKYTPNQHKLAREYVLLDNFYVDAEVSADGHNWSLANATDFLKRPGRLHMAAGVVKMMV